MMSNFNVILDQIEQWSLFETYRLNSAIDKLLEVVLQKNYLALRNCKRIFPRRS